LEIGQDAGWHQDLGAVGHGSKALALWIAFTPCGSDSPGFEYVKRRFDGHLPQIEETKTPWTVSHDTVAALGGNPEIVTPEFQPGDAVLFDQYSLHRGSVYPHMTKGRASIDTWLLAPSTIPPNLTPIYY
jgi:hypothetical protein